jgi:hypothetical protein
MHLNYLGISSVNKVRVVRSPWLKHVILSTWEAEISRLELQASPSKKFARPYINREKLGMVAYACHPSNGREA